MISAIIPWFLALLMFGMGLGLTLADFFRIAQFPKAAAVGLTGQLLLLPVCGFLVASSVPMRPEFAVGLCLLTLCPGGALSNLFTYLGRGDVALSVSMTALSGLVTVFTIPIGLNLALSHFADSSTALSLPVGETALRIMMITVIPVALGMLVLHRWPRFARQAEIWVRRGNMGFLPVIIIAMLGAESGKWFENLMEAGAITVTFNIFTIAMGYFLGRGFRLPRNRVTTLAIEVGAQNAMLGVAIAASPSMLGNSVVAIVPSVYAVTMVFLLAVYVGIVNRVHG
ncbi:MAG: bile acid:sodium symporter family protein [Gammaproteobacteria bacterium]|nr:MAG: bile acid:sodium symporter family protein [Gammaproteobacteria bacterium]RLA15644.1 MAG: bile acid:sodium symporter family protein [Gammaproteobacteria bacterium]